AQGKFSHAQEMDDALEDYKVESDSVASFLDENNYVSDNEEIISLQHLFDEYNFYCKNSNYHPCSKTTFSKRLQALGLKKKRTSAGYVFYIKGRQPIAEEPQVITPTGKTDMTVDDFFSAKRATEVNDVVPEVNHRKSYSREGTFLDDSYSLDAIDKVIENIQ
ncbi:MAG: primase-like DNA-binding domain-containing protein, partial [Dysgonomonas sp.]